MRFRTARGEEEDEDRQEDEGGSGGRFDLVLRSNTEKDFVLAVECKIGAGFRENQLRKYRAELNDGGIFKDIPSNRRFLVALTDHAERNPLDNAEGRLRWSLVHNLLLESAKDEVEGYPESMTTSFVLRQFASFLEEKGMSLKIPEMDSDLIRTYSSAMEFRESIERLLKKVRETTPGLRTKLKSKVQFDHDKNGMWLGMYNKPNEPFFYVGIQLREKEAPWYGMFIQRAWPDGSGRREALEKTVLKKLGVKVEDQHEVFAVRKRIDSAFDGNAENISDWLSRAAVLLAHTGKGGRAQ